MPRKVETLKITDENRDKGLTFVLTEMPSDQGERWANRAALALMNTGAAIPEEALGAGWAALAAVGVQALALLKHADVQPMLDELWPLCVRVVPPNPTLPLQEVQNGINCQINEVSTRYKVYFALWKMHTGFSLPVGSSNSDSTQPTGAENLKVGWITSMSRALLGLLSRFG